MADDKKDVKPKRDDQSIGTVYQLYKYFKDKKKKDRKKSGLDEDKKK